MPTCDHFLPTIVALHTIHTKVPQALCKQRLDSRLRGDNRRCEVVFRVAICADNTIHFAFRVEYVLGLFHPAGCAVDAGARDLMSGLVVQAEIAYHSHGVDSLNDVDVRACCPFLVPIPIRLLDLSNGIIFELVVDLSLLGREVYAAFEVNSGWQLDDCFWSAKNEAGRELLELLCGFLDVSCFPNLANLDVELPDVVVRVCPDEFQESGEITDPVLDRRSRNRPSCCG